MLGSDAIALDAWRALRDGKHEGLLREVGAAERVTPARIAGWRKTYAAAVVSAAVELWRARRRAVGKFGSAAVGLWADLAAVEQASSDAVARHKAGRFASAGSGVVHDLCCGMGGDARALVRMASVVGVDHHPLRAWMCRANAGCPVEAADAVDYSAARVTGGDWLHIDPARRDERRGARLHTLERAQPPWAAVLSVLLRARGGACKLGPGASLPLPVPGEAGAAARDALQRAELEWIEERGRLVQTVLWTGELARAPGERRATRLPAGDSLLGRPEPLALCAAPERCAWLIEPCAAVERAGLLGCALRQAGAGAAELAGGLGLLGAEAPVRSPWFASFEVLAVTAPRLTRLRDTLSALDAGEVVVRTRGGAADVAAWAARLRGEGARRVVVFFLRLQRKVRAFVCAPSR